MILEPGDILKDRIIYCTGDAAITINPNAPAPEMPRGFFERLRMAGRLVVRGGPVGSPIIISQNIFYGPGAPDGIQPSKMGSIEVVA